jgi:glycosyltransferase involved in cell wall biosynthesis
VEAMGAGLPVIAASRGAVPENIEQGVTGTLVPVNDADALARAIIFILENVQHAESMAKEAKMVVQQKFTWDKAANKMIDLYELHTDM